MKHQVEDLLREFDNVVCTLRVRNFIRKIILDELLPIFIEMAKRNLRGIWNFTNPGVDGSKLSKEFPEMLPIKKAPSNTSLNQTREPEPVMNNTIFATSVVLTYNCFFHFIKVSFYVCSSNYIHVGSFTILILLKYDHLLNESFSFSQILHSLGSLSL